MKKLLFILAALCLLLIVACGKKSAEQALEDKSLNKVMDQAAKDEYTRPADGKLTGKQMEMYIAVKKREAELAQAAAKNIEEKGKKIEKQGEGVRSALDAFKALGDIANFLTADIRAAQELGYNTKEYEWVRGQVWAATTAATVNQMTSGMNETLQKQIASLKEAKAKQKDPKVAETYDVQIKSLEESVASMKSDADKDDKAGLDHNIELINQYKDRINVVEAELKKWKALDKDNDE